MASEVIGLISFGIDVCERLYAYYKKWAAYHEDINEMAAKLESFIQLQKQFRHDFVAGRFQLDLAHECSRIMVKLTQTTNTLKEKLENIGDTDIPTGPSGKISAQMRRLLYPLRKSTISRLEEIVEESAEEVNKLMIKACQIYGADNNRVLSQLITSWQAANLRSEFKDIFSAMAIEVEILQPKLSQYRTKRLQSTCKWVTECELYKQWKQGTSKSLFLSGIEGCGKSMLCATVVDDLQSTTLPSEAAIAAHFFDATSRRTTSLMAALASLVFQLCCVLGDDAATETLAEIRNKRQQTYHQYKATTEDLLRAFRTAIMQAAQHRRHIYIVLDGLDESTEYDAIRGWLEAELIKSAEIVMWIVSDTRDPRLERGTILKHYTTHLDMGKTEVLRDLRLYIEHHLRLLSTNISKDKRQSLLDHLIQKSDMSSFRYVECFFDVLKSRHVDSYAELSDEMKTLPDGIFSLYDLIIDKIKALCPIKARAILEWLLVAQRPLRLEELRDAIAIERHGENVLFNPERRPSADGILEICPQLVTACNKDFWDPRTQQIVPSTTLQLSSNIVREYLLSSHFESLYSDVFSFSVKTCQLHVAEYCALFLQQTALSVESPNTFRAFVRDWKDDIDLAKVESVDGKMQFTYQSQASIGLVRRDVFDDFPILSYVAPYWPVHFGECIRLEGFPLSLTRVMDVLGSEDILSRAWALYYHEMPYSCIMDIRQPGSNFETYQRYKDACLRYASAYSIRIGKFPPLYVAIYFGWEVVVRWMLKHGFMYDGNSYDPVISSALQVAVLRRFPGIVQILVNAGCKSNEKGKPELGGRTPIQAALAIGDEDIVRILTAPLKTESPAELYRSCSGPWAYLLRRGGSKSLMETILDLFGPPFDVKWIRQALEERLWYAKADDSTTGFLIDQARQLTADCGDSIISPKGIALAAKNPLLLERLLPYAEIDLKSMNIIIQVTAAQLGFLNAPRDELMNETILKLVFRHTARVEIEPKTLGILAIHGYRRALLTLLRLALSSTPQIREELAAFENTIQDTALLHPGLIDVYYDQYPTITKLLFSAISLIPLRGELACYLADWLAMRHTLIPDDVKPPILVLDPPVMVIWQSAPNQDKPGDTDESRSWGIELVKHGPGDGTTQVETLESCRLDDLEAPLWNFIKKNMDTHGDGDVSIFPLLEERSWWPAGSGRLSDVWLCQMDDGGFIELRIWQDARIAKRNRDGMKLYGGVKEGFISKPDFASWS